MGDHRATVKIEFSIYGETYKMDSWINWGVNSDCTPIDQRVIDFFTNSYHTARAKEDEAHYEAERDRRMREQDACDRREYERLKTKFG